MCSDYQSYIYKCCYKLYNCYLSLNYVNHNLSCVVYISCKTILSNNIGKNFLLVYIIIISYELNTKHCMEYIGLSIEFTSNV